MKTICVIVALSISVAGSLEAQVIPSPVSGTAANLAA
jgi:hypothetical protein